MDELAWVAGCGGAWAACVALAVRARRQARRLRCERLRHREAAVGLAELAAQAVEARAGSARGHAARVRAYCAAAAKSLRLPPAVQADVEMAALLHEVGRLAVPCGILERPGPLRPVELEAARQFAEMGARILAGTPLSPRVCRIVRHQRERFDGQGYPDRLAGADIPLGARILAVADTYDLLVASRHYRPRVSHQTALAEIEAAAGAQFDPVVVDAFARTVDEVNAGLAASSDPALRPAWGHVTRAQRESQVLRDLAAEMGTTLSLDETIQAVFDRLDELVECSAAVVFLEDEQSGYLRARGARGANSAAFLDSRARMGAYVTGRAASRCEVLRASFVEADVMISPTLEPWTPLRSTLAVPLVANGRAVGTLNLYHELPDAFGADAERIAGAIGEIAGRALENARAFQHAQDTARTDPLTGLRNARFLQQCLEQELNRARKNGHNAAVLGIDLDRFKQVNDTFGHDRGDQVLRELGITLQQQLRNYDILVRYAGDEFVVVLPETDRSDAAVVAGRIRAAVERYADSVRRHEPGFPHVGASVGIAVYPEDGQQPADLLARADSEMYAEKRLRRAA